MRDYGELEILSIYIEGGKRVKGVKEDSGYTVIEVTNKNAME